MLLGRRDLLVRTGVLLGAGALAAAGCRSDQEVREAGAAVNSEEDVDTALAALRELVA